MSDPTIHASPVFLKDVKYQMSRLLALVDELDMVVFRLRRFSEALIKHCDDLLIQPLQQRCQCVIFEDALPRRNTYWQFKGYYFKSPGDIERGRCDCL